MTTILCFGLFIIHFYLEVLINRFFESFFGYFQKTFFDFELNFLSKNNLR